MMMSKRRKPNSVNPANKVRGASNSVNMRRAVKKKIKWTTKQLVVMVVVLLAFVLIATMSIVTTL